MHLGTLSEVKKKKVKPLVLLTLMDTFVKTHFFFADKSLNISFKNFQISLDTKNRQSPTILCQNRDAYDCNSCNKCTVLFVIIN